MSRVPAFVSRMQLRWAPRRIERGRFLTSLLLLLAVVGALVAPEGSAQETDPEARMRYGFETGRRKLTPAGMIFFGEGNAWLEHDDLRLTADRFRYYEQARLFWLVGNVHASTESLSLWADSARVDESSEIARVFGRVKIETHDGVLGFSQRGIYWRDSEEMALVGKARVIDGSLALEGDSLHFDRANGLIEAFGTVKVVDGDAQTVVTGEHGVMDRVTGYAYVDSVPELSSRRADGTTAVVASRWMDFDREAGSSRAVGDVLFRQGQTIAHADTADFKGEEELILRGSPQVEQGSQLMSGQEIRFQYLESELDRIEIFGDAKLVDSTPDTLAASYTSIPLANELSGDTLIIYMEDGEIARTKVWGNASSIYLPEDQTDMLSVNESTGDSLEIRFVDGQVESVSIMGNSEGSYRFLERERIQSIVSNADTLLAQRQARRDSLAAEAGVSLDSLVLDEEEIEPAYSGGLLDFARTADTVLYSGENTTFHVREGQIHISEGAQVSHGTMTLASNDIYFEVKDREIIAEGDPMIIDQNSKFVGEKMGYLFEHETGAVSDGVTSYEDGFYYGEHIRRMDQNTLLVKGGAFTSCDLADPHYHFKAKRMKLKVGESVVARQVTVYVSDLPVFIFPFFFKKMDSGRHSGIIFPNINLGISSREGRYIRDMGYYWATNEYTDFTFKGAYNERRDLSLQVRNRYNKRYSFSGGAEFTWTQTLQESQTGDEWTFRADHRQPEIFDVWSLSANANLTSQNITNIDPITGNANDLLPTELRSNLALSRSFDSGARLNVSGQRTQYVNATDDDPLTDNLLSRMTLPSMSLSFRSRPILPPARRRGDGNAFTNFLRDMTFGQSYRGDAQEIRSENTEVDLQNLSGSWSLSYNPQFNLGPFNFTSSGSFSESYSRQDSNLIRYARGDTLRNENGDPLFDPETGEPLWEYDIIRQENKVTSDTRPTLSWRNSLNTNLYGIFDMRVGPMRGIKHKLSFAASHAWRPELGSKQSASQSIGLRLGNEFSFKYATKPSAKRDEALKEGETRSGGYIPPSERDLEVGEDGEQIRKLERLITWELGTTYRPDEPAGQNWDDINSLLRLSPGFTRSFDLTVTQRIDPYTFEVLRSDVSTNLRVGGEIDFGGELLERHEERNPIVERVGEPALSDSMNLDQQDPWFTGVERPQLSRSGDDNTMPWSFSTRASVTNTLDQGTRATISLSADALLPISWKFTYGANFDIESGDFTNQQFSLSRDIHCWRIEFRQAVTNATDFSFRIYLKGLPDIGYKRGDAGLGNTFDRYGSY